MLGHPPVPPTRRAPFAEPPRTRVGWWAMGLGVAFVVLMGVNQLVFTRLGPLAPWARVLLIGYGWALLATGVAAGATTLVAVVRRGERSWMLGLPVLAALFVAFLLVGELLVPH